VDLRDGGPTENAARVDVEEGEVVHAAADGEERSHRGVLELARQQRRGCELPRIDIWRRRSRERDVKVCSVRET
jgi:hypothetical protein